MSASPSGTMSSSPVFTSDQRMASEIASSILGIPTPADTAHLPTALRLSRSQSATFLRAFGYPVSANRLAKLAVYGGGPEYRTWGRTVVYSPLALLEWARNRESAPSSHTSQAKQP